MTVSSQTNKVVAAGNGLTTVFSYNFQINIASDCQVIYTDALGVSTTISASLYTLSGLGSPSGGTVTYPLVGSPIASGTTLTITRQLALTQPTSIANQGPFYPSAVESAIDRAVMEVQQVNEQISRTLVAPITDPSSILPIPSAAQRANKALIFDAAGNPAAGVMPASGVISSAMVPVVGASSLSAGRTALGLGGLSVEGIGKGLQDDGAGSARVNFITEAKGVSYLIASTDHLERYIVTGPISFTLPASSTLWNGFEFMVDVYADRLNLTPNAADSIEGNATGVGTYIPSGGKAYIGTNGAGSWYVRRARTTQSAISPGGYMSAWANNTFVLADVVSATSIYYNPDSNGLIPIYDGVLWVEHPFYGLSCALNASQQLANTAHDVFVTLVNGTPTLVIGPAWRQAGFGGGFGGFTSLTNATPIVCTATGHGLQNGDEVYFSGVKGNTNATGYYVVSGVSGASFTLTGSVGNGTYTAGTGTFSSRGNGTGTSQIMKVGGIWANAVQMTTYNGSTPYVVYPGFGTYVGSILIDSVAGQVTCHKSYGQSRKMGIWNAYNRKTITMKAGDPTASWSYGTATNRPSNNNAANSIIAFVGLPEEPMTCRASQVIGTGASSAKICIGYAFNSGGSVGDGIIGQAPIAATSTTAADYTSLATIGAVTITHLENAGGASTYYGTEGYDLLTVSYRG